MDENKKKGFNKKTLKIGSFSITMTAVVIAVVILVNLLVSEIPTTYTKYDLSAQSLFSISEETETILDGVTDDVTLYLLAQRGSEDTYLEEILERYRAMNSHITVKTVDPVTNPAFLTEYTTQSLSNNSVLAVSDKRSYPVDYYEIYTTEYTEEEIYNYYYYGQMPQGTPYFRGELMLTTAIDYVTRDDLPVMYQLTGHGETALNETYLSYVDAENIAVESLTLLNIDAIPADCSSILINVPTSDISADEEAMLSDYLADGGHVILVTGTQSYDSGKMPNLTALAGTVGLEPIDGLVVENDRNHFMSYQHYLLPSLGATTAEPLSLLKNTQIYVVEDWAHGITAAEDAKNVTPLLQTTDSAFVKQDLTSNSLLMEDGDIPGACMVGAAAVTDTEAEEPGKFVWFSSTAITNAEADTAVSGGNSSVFMAVVNWMSENKIDLSIMAKQLQVEALTLTAAQQNFWSIVVIFIIPLAVLVIGFVIWLRRRKK